MSRVPKFDLSLIDKMLPEKQVEVEMPINLSKVPKSDSSFTEKMPQKKQIEVKMPIYLFRVPKSVFSLIEKMLPKGQRKVEMLVLTPEQIGESIYDLTHQINELRSGYKKLRMRYDPLSAALTTRQAKLGDVNRIRDAMTYLPQIQQLLTRIEA